MNLEDILKQRSNSSCELCKTTETLAVYTIPPENDNSAEQSIYLCETCTSQINNPDDMDANHWRCLNESMWSEVPAVQVMAWRLLSHLNAEAWAQDLLEMLYLDDELLAWAKSNQSEKQGFDHKDSNGAKLVSGDSITLTKDLNVKGANFTAKRGTLVKNISLVADNEGHIEGKVNGQQIVILTQFIKKAN